MEKNDASEALKDLTPKTQYGEFERIWPAVKEAIDRKLTLLAIWQSLNDNQVLAVSYPTFTRFVKKKSESSAVEHGNLPPGTMGGSQPAKVDRRIQNESVQDEAGQSSEDKSNQVLSSSGTALDQARSMVAATDYAKIARQVERDSKK